MEKTDSSDVFEDFLKSIENKYSKIILRQDLGKATSGILHPRTECNNDSRGKGIPGRFKIGRKTAYPTQSVLAYLREKYYKSNQIETKMLEAS